MYEDYRYLYVLEMHDLHARGELLDISSLFSTNDACYHRHLHEEYTP